MICLIASSPLNAKKWAASQHLEDDEWFHPKTPTEVLFRKNFHVIIVPDGLEHVSNSYINTMLEAAWKRGKIGRQ